MDANPRHSVKGLRSKFEEQPDQHGQKPMKKPKPPMRPIGNIKATKQKVPETIVEARQTDTITPLVVMYEGVKLPLEFTAKNGKIYRLKPMPVGKGPPPDKPPKPEKEFDDAYGDVENTGLETEHGIIGKQGVEDNFYKNTSDEDIYEPYDDVIIGRGSESWEIYEDIPAISPTATLSESD